MKVNAIQIEIGKQLAEGKREFEIADALHQNFDVIRNQKYHAFKANGCKSAAQFVYKLVKAGLIVLIFCIVSCSSPKKGCNDQEHYSHQFRAWRIIKIDTLQQGYVVTIRRMNNFLKIKCNCDCLPDSVRVGKYLNI